MNILLLNYEYPPMGGGGGVGSKQYAEAWVKAGHQVEVLTSRYGNLPKIETENGVQIRRVTTFGKKDRATATNFSMMNYLIFGFFQLLFHLRYYRSFDVINTHFVVPTGPLGYAAQVITKNPNILTIIGGDIYDPTLRRSPHRSAFYRFVNRRIMNKATNIISISSDTEKRARQYYKLERKVSVIPYGFSPIQFPSNSRRDLDLRDDRFYLVSIGRLVKRKGYEYLIKSMEALPEKIELLLIGDGPLEKTLRKLVKDNKLKSRVHLLGPRFGREKFAYLQASDCYVLSSIHEGLGIVIQEAMYTGLPIISTDNGGQVDIIKPERNCILVPIRDSQMLTTAIGRIYKDSTLRERFSANNRKDIESMLIDKNAKLYIHKFNEFVEV